MTRDYVCRECRTFFTVEDAPAGEAPPCPSCGSAKVREHWESKVRNASADLQHQPLEELRDRPG